MLQAPGRGAETRSRLIATNTPYIVRRGPRNGVKVKHYITERLIVSRIDETRATGRNLGGLFREVESTGRKVKGILRIVTGQKVTVDGHGRQASHSDHVRLNGDEVKKAVRKVRPEELEEIAGLDIIIAEREAELKDLRAGRAEIVAKAWTRGHVVTIKELEALADLPVTSEYGIDEATRKQVAAAHAELRAAFANS